MKTAIIVTMTACVGLLAGAAGAAVSGQDAGPLYPGETQGVTFSVGPNGSTIVSFAASVNRWGEPVRRELNGFAGTAALGSRATAFTGNYEAAGIRAIRMTIAHEGLLNATVRAILEANGREWSVPIQGVSDVDGLPVVLTVPLRADAGWYAYVGSTDMAATFASDLRKVTTVGMTITVMGSPAQTFTVSDFMLVTDTSTIPVELTPLVRRLMARFGVTSIGDVGILGDVDADGDGLTALQEALLGTSDDDPDCGLAARVVERTATTAVVHWRVGVEVSDVLYSVLRAESLTDAFVTVASGIPAAWADADRNIFWTDEDVLDGVPYFYRVVAKVGQ